MGGGEVGECLGDGAYPNCRRLKAGSTSQFNAGGHTERQTPVFASVRELRPVDASHVSLT